MSKQTVGVWRPQDASQEFTFKPVSLRHFLDWMYSNFQVVPVITWFVFFIVFAAEVHKWRKLPPAEKCGALASDLPESKSNLVLIIISNYKGEQ